MPRPRPVIASFYLERRDEFPGAANYFAMLAILDRSCKQLGLHHLVLTDPATLRSPEWPAGVEAWASPNLPRPLMQAFTELQARYLETMPSHDVLFCGADCIMLRDPSRDCPRNPALCLTYRQADSRYPINNGFMMVHRHSMAHVAALFRRIAGRCGTTWCDDQRSLRAELEPMPEGFGIHQRAGMAVAFMPMKRFNRLPVSAIDPCRDAFLLHFRGKARKQLMFDWAKHNGFAT